MSRRAYWDRFYATHNKSSFEWLVNYSDIVSSMNDDDTNELTLMLDVGCGTSLFGFNLKQSTRRPVFLIGVDFSRQALDLLKLKQSELNASPLSDMIQCDCRYLPFRSNIFDLIVDKGYLDSVLKNESTKKSIDNALQSVRAILDKLNAANEAKLMQITDEMPELRISLFDQFDYNSQDFKLGYRFKEIDLGNDSIYFIYYVYKTA